MTKIPKPSLLLIGEIHLGRVYKEYLEVDSVERVDRIIERVEEPDSFYLGRFKKPGVLEQIENEYVAKPAKMIRKSGAEVLFIEWPRDRDMGAVCKMYAKGASYPEISKELFARKDKTNIIKLIKEATALLNERLKKEGIPEQFWLSDITATDGMKEYKMSKFLFSGYKFKVARLTDVKEVVPIESPTLYHKCTVLETAGRLAYFLSRVYKHSALEFTKGSELKLSEKQKLVLSKALSRVQVWINNEFRKSSVERDRFIIQRIRDEIKKRKTTKYAILYGQGHIKALEGLDDLCDIQEGGMIGDTKFFRKLRD